MKYLLLMLSFCFGSKIALSQTWQKTYNKADSLMQKRDFKSRRENNRHVFVESI